LPHRVVIRPVFRDPCDPEVLAEGVPYADDRTVVILRKLD
jgi:hypothetical protein